jgi:hypothetical protein
MSSIENQMCPLFPDMPCPKGKQAKKECSVRVNGNFDPVAFFRDQLLLHCALSQNEKQNKNETHKI